MVTYLKPKKRIGVKIVGIIVFLLALTVTFADVSGLNYYCSNPASGTPDNADLVIKDVNFDNTNFRTDIPIDQDPTCPTPSIPEPATLTFMALGMGALILRRLKSN